MSIFYGPVLSRRFGFSLGLDIIPFKICVYDCLYCQLGRTTKKTINRGHYVEIDIKKFKVGLKEKIETNPDLDYITFSGSGEPTLNNDIRRLNHAIKEVTDIPVVVLTSGGLLGFDDVINDIKEVDLIKVSLDAPNQKLLDKINRPHEEITFEKNIKGLKKLLDEFGGKIWLEIMIMSKINDSEETIGEFSKLLKNLDTRIEKIHINTPVRPTESLNLKIPSKKKLDYIKDSFGARAEIIGNVRKDKITKEIKEIEDNVYQLAKRRPVTIKDISNSLGINLNQSIKAVNNLLGEEKIGYRFRENKRYYFKKE